MTTSWMIIQSVLLLPTAILYLLYIISVSFAISNKLMPLPVFRADIRPFQIMTHIFYFLLSAIIAIGIFKMIKEKNFISINFFTVYMPWMPLLLFYCLIRSNPYWLKSFLAKPRILIFRAFTSKTAPMVIFKHLRKELSKYGRCYALIKPEEHEFTSPERRYQLFGRILLNFNLNNQVRTIKAKAGEWKTLIKTLLGDTKIAVFYIDDVRSFYLLWELELSLDILGVERVIVVCKDSANFPPEFFDTNLFPNIIKYGTSKYLNRPKALRKLRKRFKFQIQSSLQHSEKNSLSSNNASMVNTTVFEKISKESRSLLTLFKMLLIYLTILGMACLVFLL